MKRAPRLPIVLASIGTAALVIPAAHAHFDLMQPANWLVQNGSGDPQKQAPCGNEGPLTMTNAVGTYKAGAKVAITFAETITHPGHYRVSLAANQGALPADPACGSVTINPSPTLPLLADGLLPHTASTPLVGPQTVEVTLPPGMTCDHCVLQVQEYMQGSSPCFYHHCAIINITQDGTPPPPGVDAGVNDDAGNGGSAGSTSGGCNTGFGSSAVAVLLLASSIVLSRRNARLFPTRR